jgi:methyltransferase (TIGR00027 family)
MEDEKPSRTAMAVALIRAEHAASARPLLQDAWGAKLVPPGFISGLSRSDGGGEDYLSTSGTRSAVILRVRYCEDQLRDAAALGVGQYVIVGAGLDSFAWRRPAWAKDLRVFELDHPATQNVKIAQLKANGADLAAARFIPADLRFLPIDEALAGTGYYPTQRAFLAWLGVTRYLTVEANAAALAAMGRATAPGSFLVLNYTAPDNIPQAPSQETTLSSWGEPFLSTFTAEAMAGLVEEGGFKVREDLSNAELIARYRDDGAEALGRPGPTRVLLAERI